VNTGGEKVWPETIESVLTRWRPTGAFCVVGIPDETWGQRLVLVTDQNDVDIDTVTEVVRASLPPWCAPKNVLTTDSIPRTSIGKIRRREVALLASARLGG
jgi:O-succinylbenzoic acid--CoA ligase